MMTKIAVCLLTVGFLTGCGTTTTTTKRETLREMTTRYASNDTSSTEPAPPAEGPEDIPAERPSDPNRNPALVPSPLLRTNAIGNP